MFIEFTKGQKFPAPSGRTNESHEAFTDCGHVLEPNEVVIDIDIDENKNKGKTKAIILQMLEVEGIETQVVKTTRGYHLYFAYDGLQEDEKFVSEASVYIGSLKFEIEFKHAKSNKAVTFKQNGTPRPVTNEGKRMALPECFLEGTVKKIQPTKELVPFDGTFDFDKFYDCTRQLKEKGYFDIGGNYHNWNNFIAALVTMEKEGRITDKQGQSVCTLIDCGDESTHDKYSRLKQDNFTMSYGHVVNVMKNNGIEEIKLVSVDKNWVNVKGKLNKDHFGNAKASRTNIETILEKDPKLSGRFAFNEFTKQIEIVEDVPWKRSACTQKWEDSDDSGLRVYIDKAYDVSPSKEAIGDVLNTVASDRSFHPVQDYFNGLPEWDGVERVESLFVDYLGVQDRELFRMQTKLFFKAIVARTFEAGCKWDYVVTFKSPQGYGKSSFIHYITPSADWYTDSIENVEGKDAMQSLKGKLIIEFGELAAMSKKEAEKVKGFLTRRVDEYRPSYGRHDIVQPRQCVFIGTTNDDTPIKDETGGRRWWIMEVTKKWFEQEKVLGKLDIDQLWAETVVLYKEMKDANGILALPNDLEKEANTLQREYTALGVYEGEITAALDDGFYMFGTDVDKRENITYLNRTCAKQLWEIVLQRTDPIKDADVKKINAIIDTHKDYQKFTRTRFGRYGNVVVFERKQHIKSIGCQPDYGRENMI